MVSKVYFLSKNSNHLLFQLIKPKKRIKKAYLKKYLIKYFFTYKINVDRIAILN